MSDGELSITKGMKTKKKIFDAAVELFEEYGVDKTSVNKIVEKAGISKGDFYVHYKSKFSLIDEYIQTLDINYMQYYDNIPENTSASSMLQAVTKMTAQILVHDIGYNVIRNCYGALLSTKIDYRKILDFSRSLPVIYKKIITKGIQKGELKAETDVDFFVQHLMISIRGMTFDWCICSHQFDLEDGLMKHIELLLKGLRA
jgi:AcrR family transcriptional regulator